MKLIICNYIIVILFLLLLLYIIYIWNEINIKKNCNAPRLENVSRVRGVLRVARARRRQSRCREFVVLPQWCTREEDIHTYIFSHSHAGTHTHTYNRHFVCNYDIFNPCQIISRRTLRTLLYTYILYMYVCMYTHITYSFFSPFFFFISILFLLENGASYSTVRCEGVEEQETGCYPRKLY